VQPKSYRETVFWAPLQLLPLAEPVQAFQFAIPVGLPAAPKAPQSIEIAKSGMLIELCSVVTLTVTTAQADMYSIMEQEKNFNPFSVLTEQS
jgi:hypothetical protein